MASSHLCQLCLRPTRLALARAPAPSMVPQRLSRGRAQGGESTATRGIARDRIGPRGMASHRGMATGNEDAAAAEGTQRARRRKPRVLSGAQPTGILHLGNYYGAIKNYVKLQDEHDAFYTIVDMHAITVEHDPKELREATRSTAALYLASGVDPSKATIFIQSHVSAHAELSWLLQCATPMGWLERMIQFKEKSRKLSSASQDGSQLDASAGASASVNVSCGLFTYPVLMAADILLYQTDLVPVGEDQKQHIELTRDIAIRINDKFGGSKKQRKKRGELLVVPEPYIPKSETGAARVMSLQDGTSKMSKSSPNDLSRINLLDSPQAILSKVKRAKTDLFDGLEFDNPQRPEATNLLSLYQLSTGNTSRESVLQECRNLRWSEFKPKLAEAIVASLQPLQKEYERWMSDPAEIDRVLSAGAQRADEVAAETLKRVKDAMGFCSAE